MELEDLQQAVIDAARAWRAMKAPISDLIGAVDALEEWHAHWEWRMTYTSWGAPNPILVDKTKEK